MKYNVLHSIILLRCTRLHSEIIVTLKAVKLFCVILSIQNYCFVLLHKWTINLYERVKKHMHLSTISIVRVVVCFTPLDNIHMQRYTDNKLSS